MLRCNKSYFHTGNCHGRPESHHRPFDHDFAHSRRPAAAPDAHRERALRRADAQTPESRTGTRTRRPRRRWNSGGNGANTTIDLAQRSVLYWDTLRQRGNQWLEHEAAGKPPVLDVQVRNDRRRARRTSGPPTTRWCASFRRSGVDVDDTKRPFVIVDPRAGHGPGIGGFKEDSEVGVALSRGPPGVLRHLLSRSDAGPDARGRHRRRGRVHPHRRRAPSGQPEAGDHRQLPGRLGGDDARRRAARHRRSARHQRRADVVLVGQRRRFADALRGRPRWAARGCRCSRRTWARGKFDGAHLVQNFENLNPANTLWEKWYHLFANIDTEPRALPRVRALVGRLLPYNEEEIRWIVNNLFVGNKLSAGRGAARPGALLRPEGDQAADHRVRVDGRQHHAAAAGVQLDRRHLLVDRGDQGERPDDRRPAARGHRPPRHLRVGQGREEGARADRRGAEVHPAAAAGPLRHGHRGDASARDGEVQLRRDAAASARSRTCARCRNTTASTKSPSRRWPRCRSCSSARIRCWCGRSCARRRPSGSPRRCAISIRCACSTGRSRTRTRCCGRCRTWRRRCKRAAAPRSADNDGVKVEKLASEFVSASLDLYRDLRDATSRGGVLRGLRQHAVAADGRRARGDPAQAQVRSALAARRARSAGHDRGGRRHRGPRAHRDADHQGRPRPAHACRRCSARASSCRPKARSRTCPRTSAAACCRRRRSSSSSSPSARSARCRSCCARRPSGATRSRCSTRSKRMRDLDDEQRRLVAELRAMLPTAACAARRRGGIARRSARRAPARRRGQRATP